MRCAAAASTTSLYCETAQSVLTPRRVDVAVVAVVIVIASDKPRSPRQAELVCVCGYTHLWLHHQRHVQEDANVSQVHRSSSSASAAADTKHSPGLAGEGVRLVVDGPGCPVNG